jgi:hypothetical protein
MRAEESVPGAETTGGLAHSLETLPEKPEATAAVRA